jgi:hypothetical protein
MSNKKNKKTASVVVAIRQKKPNNNNNKKKRIRNATVQLSKRNQNVYIAETDSACYRRTLMNPFHPECEGVRVPSWNIVPSKTFRVHGSLSAISSATGTWGALLLPSATCAVISQTGTFTGNLQQFTNSPNASFAVSEGTARAFGSDFRTVCTGWRIRNMQPFSTITGKIWVAPVALNKLYVGGQYLNTGTLITGNTLFQLFAGMADPTQVINMREARSFTFDELINNDITMVCKPCDPLGLQWRDMNAITALNAVDDIETDFIPVNVATGTVNIAQTNSVDTNNCGGFLGYVIWCTGCPNSSVIFDAEYVMHIEVAGVSPTVTGASNTLIPATRAIPTPKGTSTAETILSSLVNHPTVQLLGAKALDSMTQMAYRAGRQFLSNLMV